ncbi:class I SAM-dependent methyltransferase [Natrinema pallidum]|uniref:Type 12 methyltransferase n=1 Tax=Natrinema pallidum DSM 3751 TaxID=1227495 RepID=L9YKL9_9EURY|nr:class I SAM-dependent methyltransferase [Natrinema pallidum]ELY74679.1 type 12 methyltransferase [Natrinema pallidum DSM 3751]
MVDEDHFRNWADVYDVVYEGKNADVDFYLDFALDADGPVLEIGCGTGRVYLELLSAEVDAYGIDISAPMLSVLREQAKKRELVPQVWQADMRDFSANQTFDRIIVPFRTFLLNLTIDDQLATLQCIRDHLAPGGKLAFNMFVPDPEIIATQYGTEMELELERDELTYTIVQTYRLVDEIERYMQLDRELFRNGKCIRSISYKYALLDKRTIELLLQHTEFDDWDVYGGFNGDPLTSAGQEMVWIVEA